MRIDKWAKILRSTRPDVGRFGSVKIAGVFIFEMGDENEKSLRNKSRTLKSRQFYLCMEKVTFFKFYFLFHEFRCADQFLAFE